MIPQLNIQNITMNVLPKISKDIYDFRWLIIVEETLTTYVNGVSSGKDGEVTGVTDFTWVRLTWFHLKYINILLLFANCLYPYINMHNMMNSNKIQIKDHMYGTVLPAPQGKRNFLRSTITFTCL